jgi:hypothetical protein
VEGEGGVTARDALEFLASRRRTVLLGGAAVILHGLNRMTQDYDIWLDPLPDPKAWAGAIVELLEAAPFDLGFSSSANHAGIEHRLLLALDALWAPITSSDIVTVGSHDGTVRLACVQVLRFRGAESFFPK